MESVLIGYSNENQSNESQRLMPAAIQAGATSLESANFHSTAWAILRKQTFVDTQRSVTGLAQRLQLP
jgi:hypothetical protein